MAQTSASSVVVNKPATYRVTVTSNFLCVNSNSIILTPAFKPVFSIGNDTTLCEGKNLELHVNYKNATYLWQDGSKSPVYNVTQQGLYWVKVTNICGLKTDSIVVFYFHPNTVKIGNDTTLCFDQFTLAAETGFHNYIWSRELGKGCSDNQISGNYTVNALDNRGCKASGNINVTKKCEYTIFVPNAIVEQGYGGTEYFKGKPILLQFTMYVYNKWGDLVFQTNDINNGWNGTYLGKLVPVDVYVWEIIYYAKETDQMVRS